MSTRRVAILGAGARGGRWTRRFHALGWDVRLFDPDPAAEGAIPLSDGWSRHDTISETVAGADWICVNLPERLELLQMVVARAQGAAPEGAIVLANTAAFDADQVQSCAMHPGRVVQVSEAEDGGLLLGVTDRNSETIRTDARLTLSAVAAQIGLTDPVQPDAQSGVINIRTWPGPAVVRSTG